MATRKREIFIKLEEISQIIEILESIKSNELALKENFNNFDNLKANEDKISDNWNNYLEEINQKLNHITL